MLWTRSSTSISRHCSMGLMASSTPVSRRLMFQPLMRTCLSHFTNCFVPFLTSPILCSLKWKPPSENSIDFKLVPRFPPKIGQPNEIDWQAMPIFALYAWGGGEKYEPWDIMRVEDDEWEKYVPELPQISVSLPLLAD